MGDDVRETQDLGDSQALAAARREAIVRAAESVFSAAGYAATTMDAVAAEAGMSKGNLYNYFRSKQELFQEVVRQTIAPDEAHAVATLELSLPASGRLERLLDFWLQRLAHFRRIGRLVLEFWASAAHEQASGALTGLMQGLYGRWRERLAAVIASGIEAGEFRGDVEPHTAASLLMAALDGIEVHCILEMGLQVDEAFLAATKKAVLTALTGEPWPGGAADSR